MNPVELKNAVLLIMKNIWRSVDPMKKNMSQVLKIPLKQVLPVLLLQSFLKALE